MKQRVLIGLAICLCLMLPMAVLASEEAAATGNADVTLSTPEDVTQFRASLTQKDYAGQTVVLAQGVNYPQGAAPLSGALPFQGTFDGQGNVISGFSDNQSGFLGDLGANGTVKRLHLNIDAEGITSANYGAIANTSAGLITECYVSGVMEGGAQPGSVSIGGIAGTLQDDEQNTRARIDNCLMAASILPADGENVALVTAYGIANCTDNKRIYACLVTGELDGDSVYGISARGANHAPAEGSYYDNTVTSASAEDQFSTAKTFDEMLGVNLYSMDGWDRDKWLMEANELPKVACFYAVPETEEEAGDVETGAAPKASHTVKVTGVSLNHETAALKVGETVQLKATIAPRNATNQRVSWASADEKIATVSGKGLVTAVKAGTVEVTVKTYNGWYTRTCTVTVADAGVTGITLNADTLNLAAAQAVTLNATLAGANTAGATVVWASSDEAVVKPTPAADGLSCNLATLAAGTATVTATVKDTNLSATCAVTVTQAAVAVTGVSVAPQSLSLKVGETAKLTATVAPENASDKSLSWGSGDGNIASVSDGTVTGKGAGSTTITVTCSGITATCTVNVTAADPTPTPPATPETPTTPTTTDELATPEA